MGKEKISWSELLGVIATIGILATIMLPALVRAREAARQAYCVNNLKQWGVIFSMYDGESPNGLWPVVNQASGHPGRVCDPAEALPLIRARRVACRPDAARRGGSGTRWQRQARLSRPLSADRDQVDRARRR